MSGNTWRVCSWGSWILLMCICQHTWNQFWEKEVWEIYYKSHKPAREKKPHLVKQPQKWVRKKRYHRYLRSLPLFKRNLLLKSSPSDSRIRPILSSSLCITMRSFCMVSVSSWSAKLVAARVQKEKIRRIPYTTNCIQHMNYSSCKGDKQTWAGVTFATSLQIKPKYNTMDMSQEVW